MHFAVKSSDEDCCINHGETKLKTLKRNGY